MAPGAPAVRRPWRWPLGWLYALTLGLDAGLAARLSWVYFYGQKYYPTASWMWLAPGLWLLLAGVGMLALVLVLINAFRRRAGRALAWLGLSALAIGSCGLAVVPLMVLTMPAVSVGDPPHVYDEK